MASDRHDGASRKGGWAEWQRGLKLSLTYWFSRPRRALPDARWSAIDILFLCLTGAGLLALFADRASVPWARGLSRGVYDVFVWVTSLGKSDWVLIPLVALVLALMATAGKETMHRAVFRIHWASIAAYLFATVALSGLTSTLLKRLIGRARPKHFDAFGPYEFDPIAVKSSFASFPSGHATTIAALAFAIALLMPRWRIPALMIMLWVGISRIIVGAHYPSDVLAGFALGGFFAYFLQRVFAKRRLVFDLGADGVISTRGKRLLDGYGWQRTLKALWQALRRSSHQDTRSGAFPKS